MLLFDEINLCPPEVLEALAPLFERQPIGAPERIFICPGSAQPILVRSPMFATMNPASVGGGRNRLPRSLRSLFTVCNVEAHSTEELRMIFFHICRDLVERFGLQPELLEQIRLIHVDVHDALRRHDIGRKGGPYEFNIRTLQTLHDLMSENLQDLQQCLGIQGGEGKGSDILRASVRRLVELVYSRALQDTDDQRKVAFIIGRHLSPGKDVERTAQSIDAQSSGYVRIGDIFCKKTSGPVIGSHATLSDNFVCTPSAATRLELLACAMQSRRTVLLNGGTASGKSLLVRKLAQLTNNELVTICCDQDKDATDFVGKYVPRIAGIAALYEDPIRALADLEKALRSAALEKIGTPGMVLSPEKKQAFFRHVAQASIHVNSLLRMTADSMAADNGAIADLKLNATYSHLQSACNELPGSTLQHDTQQALNDIRKLIADREREKTESSSRRAAVVFVKSPFVAAIQQGKWVLLENLNSAPQDVVEGLNSLMEEPPHFSIEEGVLTRAGGIHPDFRLFATANDGRLQTQKISTALRNRCIVLELEPLDSGLVPQSIATHDVLSIVRRQLEGIPGGEAIAVSPSDRHRCLF